MGTDQPLLWQAELGLQLKHLGIDGTAIIGDDCHLRNTSRYDNENGIGAAHAILW